MKKIKRTLCVSVLAAMLSSQITYAEHGDMGYFGGISQGTRLPSTTELILANSNSKSKTQKVEPLPYKEVIMLDGVPVEYEGLLTIKRANVKKDLTSGTYNETYTIGSSDTTPEGISLNRNITFKVNFRKEGNQTIRDYKATNWTETITTPSGTYKLDNKQSLFNISIIEDNTPGVNYYKGNISQNAVYTTGGGAGGTGNTTTTIHSTEGTFYGYTSAWSSTETHRLNGTVITNDWQLQYQVRPSVTVNKTLNYSENEPTAISFSGNYREVMENKSGLQYDIFIKPQQFYDEPNSGRVTINSYNSFEQLIAPDTDYLKGHFAEYDIKKLFSMQILEGDPKHFQPNQIMTRGQFITALVKAIKLPIEETDANSSSRSKNNVVTIVFPDVTPDRPNYPYIMAAFESGIALGRDNGFFYEESPIERQEAIAVMLRTLGLSHLGLDNTPVTEFTDDYKIANWAKREISAASKIGIISSDSDGNINPDKNLTKAEGAALINGLINYMRSELVTDYTENIVNYPD